METAFIWYRGDNGKPKDWGWDWGYLPRGVDCPRFYKGDVVALHVVGATKQMCTYMLSVKRVVVDLKFPLEDKVNSALDRQWVMVEKEK